MDEEIATYIADIDPLTVELAEPDSALVTMLDDELRQRYLNAVGNVRHANTEPIRVAYTPLHGVGGETLVEAFARCGLGVPEIAEEQFEPDGSFPTVPFKSRRTRSDGCGDRACTTAHCDLALAHDPDADRLGLQFPPSGWRRLSGDEIGWLLADHILSNTEGDERMVVTTLVSSSLLSVMAADYGVHAEETFTGFKWIGRTFLNTLTNNLCSATSRLSATSLRNVRSIKMESPLRS